VFTQRRFLTSFRFELVGNGVMVTEKGLTYSRTYRVPFENIPQEHEAVTISSKLRLVVTGILATLAVATGAVSLSGGDAESAAPVFYGALAIVAGLSFLLSKKSYLVFKSAEPPLVVMKDRPTAQAMTAFLEELHQHRTAYLRQQYLIGAHESATADAIHKLHWLRQQGAISDSEFDALKAEIVKPGSGEGPAQGTPLH
jgi:hypothetical protein